MQFPVFFFEQMMMVNVGKGAFLDGLPDRGYTNWGLVQNLDCRVYGCGDQEGFQTGLLVISAQMTAETAWVRAEAVNIDNVHLTVNVTRYWLPCVPLGTRNTTGTKADFFKKNSYSQELTVQQWGWFKVNTVSCGNIMGKKQGLGSENSEGWDGFVQF